MARKNSEGFVAVHAIHHTVDGKRVETAPGQAYEGEDTDALLASGAIRKGTAAEDEAAALGEPGSENTPQARGDEPVGYAAGTAPNQYAAADNAAIAAGAQSRPNDGTVDHAPASRSSKTK